MRFINIMALIALLSGGCANYQFDLVKPPELARRITADQDSIVKIGDLEYHLRTAENRVVMDIYNTGNTSAELLGTKSSLVDPNNQSHPLRDETIPPGSYIKLILPPFRPPAQQTAPLIGIGASGTYGSANDQPGQLRNHDVGSGGGSFAAPSMADVDDESGAYYWDWDGPGEIRLILVFHQADHDFQQQLVLRKSKA